MTVNDDPFDDARSGFVKLDDLLGRLLLIAPQSVESRPSTLAGARPGDTYESVTCDVIVLDGKTDDKIEEIPLTLEGIFISGGVIVPQIKPKIKKKGLVLGRLGQQPSQKNPKFGKAWVLEAPTDEDKALARPYAREYIEKNSDPFADA